MHSFFFKAKVGVMNFPACPRENQLAPAVTIYKCMKLQNIAAKT